MPGRLVRLNSGSRLLLLDRENRRPEQKEEKETEEEKERKAKARKTHRGCPTPCLREYSPFSTDCSILFACSLGLFLIAIAFSFVFSAALEGVRDFLWRVEVNKKEAGVICEMR